MKNLLLIVMGLGSSLMVNAQFTTGQKVAGGQLSFSSSKSTSVSTGSLTQKNTSGGISFTLSRFKNPLLLTGVGIQYGYLGSSYDNGVSLQDTKTHQMGAFYEITKLQPLAKKLYLGFTGTAGANYTIQNTSTSANTSSKMKGYNVYLNGGMGVWYALSQRFLLIGNINNLLAINYSHGKTTSDNNPGTNITTGNSFSISTGLNGFSLGNIGFGVRYLLK